MRTPSLAPDAGVLRRVAADSAVGSSWTLVSRASGLVRVVVVGAVLGPTQFANLYQSANTLPNLAFELLTGALLASLVVPVIVRYLDEGDTGAATRLASGFLSLSVLSALTIVLLAIAAGPLVLGVLTAGVPEGERGAGTGAAWLLLGLLLLQVPLYLVAGMAAAVQNARGHFALAAAAPSVENVGIVLVMSAYAVAFPPGTPGGQGLAEVAVLGVGTTGAVFAHAAVQWWGAHHVGVPLVPVRRAWRDAEVWQLLRLAVPTLGYAGLNVVRYLCVLVVVAAVPGGVVAFSIAYAFYNLPVALGARPVAQAALPALSRAHHRGDTVDFSETFSRAFGLALFLAVPAAVGYLVLGDALAMVVAWGEMATPTGRELLRAALTGVSLGVIGEAALLFGTQAAYARRDGRRPLRAVALRTVLTVAGSLVGLTVLDGAALLLAVGLSLAVSDVVAGALLCWTIHRSLPRASTSLTATVTRTLAAGLTIVPVVLLQRTLLPGGEGPIAAVLVVLVTGAVGALTYLGVQWVLGSPEVAGLLSLLPGSGRGAARASTAEPGRAPAARAGVDVRAAAAVLLLALLVALLSATRPTLGVVLGGVLALVVLAAVRPVWALGGYIAVNPLLVGSERGAIVPGLRLNEALLLPVLAGLALVVVRRWAGGSGRRPRSFHPLDLVVLALASTGSVSTLLWMYARGREIGVDDLQYALVLWKLAVLYAAARVVLRDARAIRWALSAVVVSALLVGAVGVLQAIGIGPVIDALTSVVSTEEGGYELTGHRAMSTLGNPIAYGDLMVYAGVVSAALALRTPGRTRLLWGTTAALGVCALASGQVSVAIGLAVAWGAWAVITGTVRTAALAGVTLVGGSLAALQPVLAARLGVTDPGTGLPVSWTGRYGRVDNLQRYVLPEIAADHNWLFGVRTAGRIPAAESWREWVYIESGYVWALWTGGLPLLLAVLALLVLAVRSGRRLASSSDPMAGAVGVTVATAAWTLAALMVFDPHLTFRGAGELFVLLLAVGATLDAGRRPTGTDEAHRDVRTPVQGVRVPPG